MGTSTIRDVAREAGVSIATVSYVLNGTRRVTEETHQRVLSAVQRLGYRANIMARNLQASETRLFGYTWHPAAADSFNPILDHFLQAMAEAAARHDYRVLTFPTTSIQEELAVYQEMVRIGQVDGFILSNTNLGDERVRTLLEIGFPFVAFGRSDAGWDFPWVDVDGAAGIEIATRHLIERGHRRIACLTWPEGSLTGQYRLSGYTRGMIAAGLPVEPRWVSRTGNFYSDAYAATLRLLALPPEIRPSAVIAMSDLMAMGVINAGWEAGLQVGRDLAVVGFDDAPIAGFLHPALTSLHQPISEVGERLAVMLAALCSGQTLTEQHVLLVPKLVIRASSSTPYIDRQ